MKTTIICLFICLFVAVNVGATEDECMYFKRSHGLEFSYHVDCASIKQYTKTQSQFYKVLGEDIRIRKDKITGWRIEIHYALNGLSTDLCKGEDMIISYQTMYRDGKPLVCREKMYMVEGEYLNQWYTFYQAKKKQACIDWLDRNVP
jgi:hypothetical protein